MSNATTCGFVGEPNLESTHAHHIFVKRTCELSVGSARDGHKSTVT